MNYNEWHSLMVGIILKVIPKWHERRKTFHAILLLMCRWTGILRVLYIYMYILYQYLHLRTPFQFYNLLVLCEIFFHRTNAISNWKWIVLNYFIYHLSFNLGKSTHCRGLNPIKTVSRTEQYNLPHSMIAKEFMWDIV